MAREYISGFHAVLGVLTTRPNSIHQLFVERHRKDTRVQSLFEAACDAGVEVALVEKTVLDEMLPTAPHQGVVAALSPVLAQVEYVLNDLLDSLERSAFLLILDGVQDPHNLGACLRSACAAGVQAVIVPKHHSVGLTPTVRRVSCGGAEQVPLIQVTNLARTLRALKQRGIWLYGAAEEGSDTLYDLDLTGPVAWVLGSEGRGLRDLTRKHCDYLVSIPTAGALSSLNVSVAAGVCLFESVRQRQL